MLACQMRGGGHGSQDLSADGTKDIIRRLQNFCDVILRIIEKRAPIGANKAFSISMYFPFDIYISCEN